MTISDTKERILCVIDDCDDRVATERLRAVVADLELEELRCCPKCGNEDLALQACDVCGDNGYEGDEKIPKPTKPMKHTSRVIRAWGVPIILSVIVFTIPVLIMTITCPSNRSNQRHSLSAKRERSRDGQEKLCMEGEQPC